MPRPKAHGPDREGQNKRAPKNGKRKKWDGEAPTHSFCFAEKNWNSVSADLLWEKNTIVIEKTSEKNEL